MMLELSKWCVYRDTQALIYQIMSVILIVQYTTANNNLHVNYNAFKQCSRCKGKQLACLPWLWSSSNHDKIT